MNQATAIFNFGNIFQADIEDIKESIQDGGIKRRLQEKYQRYVEIGENGHHMQMLLDSSAAIDITESELQG